jgi:hypothetical protein
MGEVGFGMSSVTTAVYWIIISSCYLDGATPTATIEDLEFHTALSDGVADLRIHLERRCVIGDDRA